MELLVVVAIIGILASVGAITYNGFINSAKQNAAKNNHNLVVNFVNATMSQTLLNGGYFKGYVSIVRIYNGKALSAAEVLQNFNANRGRFNL